MHLGLIRFLRSIFPVEIINKIICHENWYFAIEVAGPHWKKVVDTFKSIIFEKEGRLWLRKDPCVGYGWGNINFRDYLHNNFNPRNQIKNFITNEFQHYQLPFNFFYSLPSDHIKLYFEETYDKELQLNYKNYEKKRISYLSVDRIIIKKKKN